MVLRELILRLGVGELVTDCCCHFAVVVSTAGRCVCFWIKVGDVIYGGLLIG